MTYKALMPDAIAFLVVILGTIAPGVVYLLNLRRLRRNERKG